MLRLIYWVLIAHVAALGFGLAGLLIAVPNPHLWADSELGVRVYSLGMRYAGASHIILAAVAMILFGVRFLGAWRTLTFLAVTIVISLTAELVGTTTGFPFGAYSYTSGLGYKIFGEVPFTIPLSWFYMGFASLLLAGFLARRLSGPVRLAAIIGGGAFLLTSWDLVLDPAMAHTDLAARFWIWEETGAYFGMPAQNFLGWFVTGTAFMTAALLVWRWEVPLEQMPPGAPYTLFMANLLFAIVISAATGLWWPILIAGVLGGVPATVALFAQRARNQLRPGGSVALRSGGGTPGNPQARRALGIFSRMLLARSANLRVDGVEHIPLTGPVILAARHYHHLYDGCAIIATSPRQVHVLVALDWVRTKAQRTVMEFACRAAGWPVVLRSGRSSDGSAEHVRPSSDVYQPSDVQRYTLRGWREALSILTSNGVLLVFPEGYPTIDPHESRSKGESGVLPFRPGFARLAEAAERRGGERVAIVPTGLAYERGENWEIGLRFSRPVYVDQFESIDDLMENIRRVVEASSVPALGDRRSTSRETVEAS